MVVAPLEFVRSILNLCCIVIAGEKLYSFGLSPEGVTDDEASVSAMETDDSLQNSTTLPTLDEDSPSMEAASS